MAKLGPSIGPSNPTLGYFTDKSNAVYHFCAYVYSFGVLLQRQWLRKQPGPLPETKSWIWWSSTPPLSWVLKSQPPEHLSWPTLKVLLHHIPFLAQIAWLLWLNFSCTDSDFLSSVKISTMKSNHLLMQFLLLFWTTIFSFLKISSKLEWSLIKLHSHIFWLKCCATTLPSSFTLESRRLKWTGSDKNEGALYRLECSETDTI